MRDSVVAGNSSSNSGDSYRSISVAAGSSVVRVLRSSPRAFRSGYQLRLSTRATERPARVRCAATIYRVQELFGHNVAMRCDGSKGLLFLSAILVAVGVTSDASRAATLGN